MERFFTTLENALFRSKQWVFVSALYLLIFFKAGISILPSFGLSQNVAQNPFVLYPHFCETEQFAAWNWFGPFLGWAMGMNGPASFTLLHFAFFIAFLALFAFGIFSRLPDSTARKAMLLFAILPVSSALFTWIGTDTLTLFLMLMAMLFPKRLSVVLAIGFCLGLQHFEQALVAAVALGIALILDRHRPSTSAYRPAFPATLLAGAVSGKILLYLLFRHFHMLPTYSRIEWTIDNSRTLYIQYVLHIQEIFWAALGLGWLAFVKYVMDSGKKGDTPRYRMVRAAIFHDDRGRPIPYRRHHVVFPDRRVLDVRPRVSGFYHRTASRLRVPHLAHDADVLLLGWGLSSLFHIDKYFELHRNVHRLEPASKNRRVVLAPFRSIAPISNGSNSRTFPQKTNRPRSKPLMGMGFRFSASGRGVLPENWGISAEAVSR
jgi:hypothetical protein